MSKQMTRHGRILVVDDSARWRAALAEALQRGGFYVDLAATTAEARDYLRDNLYHLLVLDVRMDEADPSNVDGLDLLRELDTRGLSEALQVIMLSAYDTKERVRTAFREHNVADFLSKDRFDTREFLENVRQIFSKELKSNLELTIHWQKLQGTEEAVLNLEIDGIRLKRDPALKSRVAIELEDLLCRLFSQAHSVLIRPLALGQSSTGVLWVQPFYHPGHGRPVVVKFGDFRIIEEEHSNFKTYVQPFIGGGRNTSVIDRQRTPHLGGIIYSLLGSDNDHLEDFGSFYHHAELPKMREVLDRLFLDTCGTWYENARSLQPYNLTADYQTMFGFTRQKIADALRELQKYIQVTTVQGKQAITFKSLNGERVFTHPLPVIDEPPLVYPASTCTTHGDFNQHNILVDGVGHTWLIDFQSTGPGHIFRDIAQLDSEIRFVLLAPQDATLNERLQLEEELCRAENFSQLAQLAPTLPTDNLPLAKAYASVLHLRTLARRFVAHHTGEDMYDYYVALFYNAINTLRFYGLASGQREHALLSASLLADRLRLKG